MGTALPTIRGGSNALYPFTQTYTAITGISDSQSANPARHVKNPPIVQFDFPYDPVYQTAKDTLKAFFASAKGQFTTNLTALGGSFTNLGLTTDEFMAGQKRATMYGLKWTVIQTMAQNLSPGSSGGAFPTLSTGAISELPYTQKKRWQTALSAMESGPRYTFAEFGNGITNFPSDGLMSWELDEGELTDVEVNTKVAHWLANWGDCFPFTFKDEDGITYSNVYYASPNFVIERYGLNQSAIKTALIQLN